jgi:hypothetical protein
MAVIYTPSGQDSITIGGTASTGPFPAYSIKRSTQETKDGHFVGHKYSIGVRGTVIINSSVDITESGARQNSAHDIILNKLSIVKNSLNYGLLEIVPYGGQDRPIVFLDAKLIDIDIPEPSDENAFNTLAEYSFSFEATLEGEDGTPEFLLDSIEESWSIALDESYTVDPTSIVGQEKFDKTYTITHTVSAVGKPRMSTGGSFEQSAWNEARKWVMTRLVDSPATTIIEDFFGGPDATTFLPRSFSDTASSDLINLNDYKFFNHIRTPEADLVNGNFSVTETWSASKYPATLTLDVDSPEDENGIVNINISGTIEGYDVSSYSDQESDKFQAAYEYFKSLEPNIYNIADFYFKQFYPDGALRQYPKNKTVTRNITAGTITFEYSFDDTPELIPNTISNSYTIDDDNEFRDMQIIAIINVIARRDGPVIQNMATTKERRRSIQFSCVMQKNHRAQKPYLLVKDFVNNFKPEGSYVDSITDNWEPITGTYSYDIAWVY